MADEILFKIFKKWRIGLWLCFGANSTPDPNPLRAEKQDSCGKQLTSLK
ncbi:hypothetical protein [Laceyella putida]|uniref:Uncharacterized protein n=1 Tax=Laceyella putida TaxID=110101 RepID=A0ABW2RPM1_9BACL